MYSSGLPVLYIILAVTLSIIYVVDKFLILNFHKRTKVVGDRALYHFVEMLKVGILLHIITGSLMFMNKNIFDEDKSFNKI